jgi:hypothetical protein
MFASDKTRKGSFISSENIEMIERSGDIFIAHRSEYTL